MLFKKNDKVKIKSNAGDKYKDLKGKVISSDIDIKTNKNRYLIEGTGLSGAAIEKDKCSQCKRPIIEVSENLRYFYEEHLEEDK